MHINSHCWHERLLSNLRSKNSGEGGGNAQKEPKKTRKMGKENNLIELKIENFNWMNWQKNELTENETNSQKDIKLTERMMKFAEREFHITIEVSDTVAIKGNEMLLMFTLQWTVKNEIWNWGKEEKRS